MSTASPVAPRVNVLESLRRRWWLAAVLPLVLGILGYVAGLCMAPTYTASARVAVGAGHLTSGAIAGFPEAATTLAANYARYVNSSGVTDSAFATEGVELSASPIPESYVILIEAKGKDQQAVVAGAQKAADRLIKVVNDGKASDSSAQTLAQYQKLSAQVAQARSVQDAAQAAVGRNVGKPGEAAARKALATAQTTLLNLQVQLDAIGAKYTKQVSESSTDANLTLAAPAEISGSTKSARAQQLLLVGLAAGAMLALALAWLLGRRDLAATSPAAARAPHDAAAAPAAAATQRDSAVEATPRA